MSVWNGPVHLKVYTVDLLNTGILYMYTQSGGLLFFLAMYRAELL